MPLNSNLIMPPAAIAEAQGDEIVVDYTQWKLPKAAKARLGKGGINVLQFSPDRKLLCSRQRYRFVGFMM